jgi:hypothetical protein
MFHATSYLSKAWKGTKSEKQPASRGRPSVERNCPTLSRRKPILSQQMAKGLPPEGAKVADPPL